ncbi:hypothetical protein [Mediterranea sp. An20]|uniref:hypothetical protein n=1 Tax=Mediterranea sp. An20 TaxID=1965586 RepID=UPI00111FC6A3|nr:hypothetical protein [Mediterranea sp. An20]
MKKKLMMVAVLLGALSLGACVDDNESASVTNIRDAKAEQLRSLATLNEAKAEAELIRANAEAALKNAKAAYEQAQADKEQFELQKAQEEYAIAIENIRLQYQLDLLRLQKKIQEAQNELDDAEYSRITELFGTYFYELDVLTGYQEDLVKEQAKLARLEAGITTAEKENAETILQQQQLIDQYNAEIEVLKSEDFEGLDNSELYAKLAAARTKYEMAATSFANNQACSDLMATVAPLQEADAKIEDLQELVDDIEDATTYAVIDGTLNSYVSYYIYETVTSIIPAYQVEYVTFYSDLRLNEEQTLLATRDLADELAKANGELGKPEDKKDTQYEGALTAYAMLALANENLKTAQDNLTKANGLGKDDVLNGMDKETAIKTYTQDVRDAELAVAQAKDNLAGKQAAADEALENQTKFKDAIAALDVDAYNKAVADFETLLEAQQDAYTAWQEAWNENLGDLSAEYNAIYNLISYGEAGADINARIAELERKIAEANETIAGVEENLTDATWTLENAEATIAELQEKIKAQTVIVESCKAALEAAINSDLDEETPSEPETPETPEEGGEAAA